MLRDGDHRALFIVDAGRQTVQEQESYRDIFAITLLKTAAAGRGDRRF